MSLRTRLTLWKKRLPAIIGFLGNVVAGLTAADVLPHMPKAWAIPLFIATAVLSAAAKAITDTHGIEVPK